MVNRFDMGQNGVLEPDKLMFAENLPGPEKIEVVMGRCFPLNGPGGTYDIIPIPVVRKIVYKNSDGATFTQTFGDLINSENENYKIPTSVIEQHFDAEKQGCRPKTFLKHEASDSTRDDPLISHNNLHAKENGNPRINQGILHNGSFNIGQGKLPNGNLKADNTVIQENKSDIKKEKMFSDAQVKNVHLSGSTQSGAIESNTQKRVTSEDKVSVSSTKTDHQERIIHNRQDKFSPKSESFITRNQSIKYPDRSPDSTHVPINQLQQENRVSRKLERHGMEAFNNNEQGLDYVDQHQHKVTPLQIDSDTMRKISKANSPRFRIKRVENTKSPEMTGREAWEETQKKKAQLREEFFKVPYEECNREAIRGGMGGRHKSEPRLNSLAKERKKRNSLNEKRVHFNMDDSQLEDIRKWREERRMQANPQLIKTVARIYSIDAPNNERKFEYIDSFTAPKAEVPVAVTIQDNVSVRAKYSRPTDLDSLSGNLANKVNPGSFVSPDKYVTGSNKTGMSEITSRVPPTSQHNLPDQTHRPAQVVNHTANGTNIVSPGASLYATFSKPPTYFDGEFDSHLRKDQQESKNPIRSHSQGPSQSVFSPKLSQQNSGNSRLPSKSEDQSRTSEPYFPVQLRKQPQINENSTVKSQENSGSNSVVPQKDLRPTSLPTPLPRVKSLTLKEDSYVQGTPSRSTPTDGDTSEKPKAFVSRRATSLDRATIRKRTASLPLGNSSYLKSPGLILSHMRSPTPTSLPQSQSFHTPSNFETSNAFSPYSLKNTSPVQSNQPSFSSFGHSAVNARSQPTKPGVIKSYIPPKRNSVTVLQKEPQPVDVGATTKAVNNSGHSDYRTHKTQHFKSLDNTNINRSGFPDMNSSRNDKRSKQFYTNPPTTNSEATHKDFNKENEHNVHSQKTLPNGKGNSVNILMTRGESYSKHHLVLNSHTKSATPRMTVKKIIVPASSVQAHVRPVPIISSRSAPSPTPSCASSHCSFGSSGSSSGCFSGSPSPTPTPSPIRTRASRVPTDL